MVLSWVGKCIQVVLCLNACLCAYFCGIYTPSSHKNISLMPIQSNIRNDKHNQLLFYLSGNMQVILCVDLYSKYLQKLLYLKEFKNFFFQKKYWSKILIKDLSKSMCQVFLTRDSSLQNQYRKHTVPILQSTYGCSTVGLLYDYQLPLCSQGRIDSFSFWSICSGLNMSDALMVRPTICRKGLQTWNLHLSCYTSYMTGAERSTIL